MEIKKETKIVVKTTDDKEMEKGDMYIFAIGNKGMFGKYLGVTKKGAVEFEVDNEIDESFTFSVMPKSIRWIFLADIKMYSNPEYARGDK